MATRRPRTERRAGERATRKLIHDRERLWSLSSGGTAARPIEVDSPAVIEVRVRAMACPQCEGEYAIREHAAAGAGVRMIAAVCQRCHAPRQIWFRLGSSAPS
jgi:hypothetical protein